MIPIRFGAGLLAIVLCAPAALVRADEPKVDVRENIRSGLEWLAKNQIKRGEVGYWEANGNAYPTAMTGLAGMCFLMEGSTMTEGRYSDNIRKAVNMYVLGDNGYKRLFPSDANPMRWSDFRTTMYGCLKSNQNQDGSWNQGNMGIGPIYVTSVNLTILQLENSTLPIYQR
jgi:hypothetical protein